MTSTMTWRREQASECPLFKAMPLALNHLHVHYLQMAEGNLQLFGIKP